MLNNKKEHYKMYKSGKMWVYSSVVIATLLGGATTVSADTSSNATSNVSSASNASSTATQASTTTSLNSKTTNKAEINAKDTTLVAGPNTKWTAEDNFVSATDQTGKDVSFTNIAVEGSVDTNKAGQYAITYKFTDVDGTVVSKTIRVTVTASNTSTDSDNTSTSNKSDNLKVARTAKLSEDASSYTAVTVTSNSQSSESAPLDSTSAAYILNFSIKNTSTSGQIIPKGSTFTVTISPDQRVDWTKFLKFNYLNQDGKNFTFVDNNNGTGTITVNTDLTPGTYNFILNMYTQDPGYDWDQASGTHSTNPNVVAGSVSVAFNNTVSETHVFDQSVYVKPLPYNPTPNNVPGYAGSGNNNNTNINNSNYANESSPIEMGNSVTLRNPNDLNKNGSKYFSYIVNYQATIGGQGGAQLGITSDDSFDLDNYHLFYEDNGNYIDITNDSRVKWTVSDKSIFVDASAYLNDVGWGPLFLRAYVPESDINAVNNVKFRTGWFTNFKNTSMFQNVDAGSSLPYFRGQDKTVYATDSYSPLTDIYAFSGTTSLTDKITITNYDGYPQDGKNLKAGSYVISYSVVDGSGNIATFQRTITVLENKSGIDAKDSTLVAGPNTKWTAGDNFVSATDQAGNPVELKDIKVTGAPDPTKAGQYDVTYSYTDASGNTVSKTITVTVVDSKASIDAKDSTLVAGPNTKWTAGDNFISATDQAGNPVELKDITVKGSVDTNKAGQYEITYSYTDASGNTVSKTIIVTVLAPSSDSGSNSSNSKTPDSPTVKVSYRVTKNNNSGNKQLPDTGENIDGLIGSLVSAIFAASLGILTIVSKKKNDN